MKKLSGLLGALMVASMVLTACPAPAPQVIEKVVTQVVTQEVEVIQTRVVETVKEVEKVVEVAAEDYTTPHPILSDIRVRQAIAHCINRDELIASVYPWLSEAQRASLQVDSFLPETHWAYGGPYAGYEYSVEKGVALLDAAGWQLAAGDEIRLNDRGETLAVKFVTSNSRFRQDWAAVMESNLLDCGIQMVRLHAPVSWWYGDTSGLARRDFELGALAWISQSDPGGRTLYACDQIPLPSNGWGGQNIMGWCNPLASDAIIRANNTLIRKERIAAYDVVQEEFSKDIVSLPLFRHAEGEAWANSVSGIKVDPTEYGTANAVEWARTDGGDKITVGFLQEPFSLFSLVESAAEADQASHLAKGVYFTRYNYDIQPVMQTSLSTLESGLARNDVVEVKAGDIVYNAQGQPVKLKKNVKIFDAGGKEVTHDGASTVKMKQLTVTYQVKDFTWSDGVKGSQDDLKLGARIECDKESGAISFVYCDVIEKIEWGAGLEYTVTTVPGYQNPFYFSLPFGFYPAHQVVADGRKLADVPAAEWTGLPEIAEKPLSFGPFMLMEWKKGERMTFEANPYADPQPKVKKIAIVILQDTNQAVSKLLSGDIEYLVRTTLGAGSQVEAVLKAAAADKIQAEFIPNPTWEHVDFNLYTR